MAAGIAASLLAACAAAPVKPDGAEAARTRLIALQSNTELASRAPLAIKEADAAVMAAQKPQADKVVGAHLVFMADRRISLAQAQAENSLAVDQRKTIEEQREAMRLAARTQEADAANRRAAAATADAGNQKRDADAARSQADAARIEAGAASDAAAMAQRNAAELQAQIDALQAKATDRGLVLTLGDVLFATGAATLNAGGTTQLAKLAVFMNKYPERTLQIEGYTDSVGSTEYNQALSQRRADAVKAFLVGQSIATSRMISVGKGKESPVGDNSSVTGRQQNRRVEIVIGGSVVASR